MGELRRVLKVYRCYLEGTLENEIMLDIGANKGLQIQAIILAKQASWTRGPISGFDRICQTKYASGPLLVRCSRAERNGLRGDISFMTGATRGTPKSRLFVKLIEKTSMWRQI